MKSIFGKVYLMATLFALPYFCYFAEGGEPGALSAEQEKAPAIEENQVNLSAEQKKPRAGRGLYALAAGVAIALASLGGALGQSRVGASAMEGIARNPQAQKIMLTPMIIALALIESCVILSFVIAMNIAAQIP